ncbi:MAG: hypothetical protein AABX34_00050 [Nanoarchaeota archaeon]
MHELLPNQWYTIPDAFGTESKPLDLSYIDVYRQEALGLLRMEPRLYKILRILEDTLPDSESVDFEKFDYLRGLYRFSVYEKNPGVYGDAHTEYLPQADFMESWLRMYLGVREERLDITLRRHIELHGSTTPIHFVSGTPSYAEVTDITDVADGYTRFNERTEEIMKLRHFLIAKTHVYGPLSFLIEGIPEGDIVGEYNEYYRYELLVKSKNGTFVSDAFIHHPLAKRQELRAQGGFVDSNFWLWVPEGQRYKTGLLYVPLYSNRITPLEIMLREVTILG